MPEESKKSPSETFAEMMKNFGSAMAEIFNDPKLKEKAKEFGESASDSAKAFAGRFKDEEVKDKFKDLGKAAKTFGESVSDYFKDDKEKSDSQQAGEQPGDAQPTGNQNSSNEESKKKPENGLAAEAPIQTENNQDTAKEKLLQEQKTGKPPDQDATKGNSGNTEAEKPKKYEADRNSRIAGYSAAIAWGIILIIFFNFFNRYIAFYTYDAALRTWSLTPMLTENFGAWLPIFNVSMIVSIVGSIILIINDSFYFNNVTNIVMNIFGISSVVTLLTLFPFDFTKYQGANLDPVLFPIFKIGLALIIVGLSVGIFVRFIKIVIKIAKGS
jgi:hypothetical protein